MLDTRVISPCLLLLIAAAVLGSACEMRCPKGYTLKDEKCYRNKDGGAFVDPIDILDGGDDVGEPDGNAGEVIEDASNADDDGSNAQSDANDMNDATPLVDGASNACSGSAGTAVCAGPLMHLCSAQATIESSETCASAQQCQLGVAGGRCAPCLPGKFQCKETRLERCANDGASWELVTTCGSASLCNATAGACTDKACTPTTRTCSADTLNGCNASLTALEPIMTCGAGLCDQAQGQCDVCVANAKTCAGDDVVSCSGDGQRMTQSACPQEVPKCTGTGRCVECLRNADCRGDHELCVGNSCVVQPYCGDGNTDTGEECDPGAAGETVWSCTSQCKRTTTYTWCGRNLTDAQGKITQGVGCATGELCFVGMCAAQCNLDGDCPTPARGTAICGTAPKLCLIPDCASASDCAPGLVCVRQTSGGGTCLGCGDEYPCPSGTTCKFASPGDAYRKCLP